MDFRVLGLLEVLDAGEPVELRGNKVRSLLAMLLLHPGMVVSADQLIEALWGEDPPPTAVSTLQTYVSHLRKALGAQVVQTRSPGYVLAVEADRIDAVCFERLVAEGRALASTDPPTAIQRLNMALELWRGPALADFIFEDFARGDIARLEELRVVAIEERTDAELALGNHDQLVGDLRSLVDDHPLRERLRGQLILALYRAGRQAEALRAFSEMRRLLGEELGIEPSPALRQLEADVLAQRPSLDWKAPVAVVPTARSRTNLPRPRSSFVGRDAQVTEVAKLMGAGELVSMIGPGGVGKTRLAIEVARRLHESYPDGVWLVELATLSEANLVGGAVASCLGVREEAGRQLLDTLIDSLRHQRLLLVLDNCEHLLAGAAKVTDALLAGSESISILATSREPLRVEGERVWRIPVLDVPNRDDLPLEVMAGIGAVRLFCERASAQGPFTLDCDNAAAVAQLTRRLDGIPLALELAAAVTPSFEPAEILEHLDQRFELLVDGYRTVPRQETLWTAMQWGHDLLSGEERRLFRRLAVFAGGFSAEAVERVCGGDGGIVDTSVGLLGSLVQRSMVEVSPDERGPRRYSLLETLRAFARAQLKAAGEEEALGSQHLDWVLELAEGFEAACDGPEEQAWVERLVTDNDNLRQALEWAIVARPGEALRLAGRLGNFWARRGELTEGRRWLSAVLDAAPEAVLEGQALALRRAGVLALLQDDQSAALSLLHQAAGAYRQSGNTASLGHVLGFLGVVAYEQGDLSGARHIIEESLSVLRDMGDERGVTRCRARLGAIAAMQGDFDLARPLLEEAVRTHAAVGDTARTATSLLNLGFARFLGGDVEEAQPLLEHALALHRAREARLDIAQALVSLGELDLARGNLGSARVRFEEALALSRDLSAAHVGADAVVGLATTAVRCGEVATAEEQLREAMRLSKGRGLVVPTVLERMAEVAIAKGQEERGAKLLGAAAARREAIGVPLPPVAAPVHEHLLDLLRTRLGSTTVAQAWARGEAGAMGDALTQGRDEHPPAWVRSP